MAKIFSINPYYEIVIDDEFILMNEEDFISFELPYGFNWMNHAQGCEDCKAFLLSFGKHNYQWLLEVLGERYYLDLSEFASLENYFSNTVSYISSNSFNGTKLKFKRKDSILLEPYQVLKIKEENYESCQQIKSALEHWNSKSIE